MADTSRQVLREATNALQQIGVETAALDARLLLQAAASLTHADIIANPDLVLSPDAVDRFNGFVARRLRFEPVSRILGEREFYGREFRVTPAVLDPRPDTEILIDAALAWGKGKSIQRVLDLGTGTGILALTLLAEWQGASAVAVDVSAEALAVAEHNAERLGLLPRVEFRHSDWFSAVDGQFDVIVSNPPYIPAADVASLAPDVRSYDPHLALVGGEEGVETYAHIAARAGAFLKPRGAVFVEIGAGQREAVTRLFLANGFKRLTVHADLGGVERVLAFCSE